MSGATDVMESTKEALGGLAGLYDHWQDILDTAEEIEELSGRVFARITSSEFLAMWREGTADSLSTLQRLDLSGLDATLQQELANMVARGGKVLSEGSPDDVETLMDKLKDYIPEDMPQRDKLLAVAHFLRNNVSVDIREHVPAQATSPSTAGTTSAQTPGTPSTPAASSVAASGTLTDHLIEMLFPELERYEGNLQILFYRMQDILERSGIEATLEQEVQATWTTLSTPKTPAGNGLKMEAWLKEVLRLVGRLAEHGTTLLKHFMSLLFEAGETLVEVLKAVRDKLNAGTSSWPDSPLKSFVQQLGLERAPGLATLPSLLISMLAVPAYKAATGGDRPTIFRSILQAEEEEENPKDKRDKASAWIGLIRWMAETMEAVLDPRERRGTIVNVIGGMARILAITQAVLDIVSYLQGEAEEDAKNAKEEPTKTPLQRKAESESDDKSDLERAAAWVTFVKDGALLGSGYLVELFVNAHFHFKFRPLKTTWGVDWDARRQAYAESITWYQRFTLGKEILISCLEVVSLGLGGRLVRLDREHDVSYDMREHASMLLAPSLTLIDKMIALKELFQNRGYGSRSLAIGGRIGVKDAELTASISDRVIGAPEYYWCTDGVLQATTEKYTQAKDGASVGLVVTYGDQKGAQRILYAERGPVKLRITGEPRAGKELSVRLPDGATSTSYKWYKMRTGTRMDLHDGSTYQVAVGNGASQVLHGDEVCVCVTYTQAGQPGVEEVGWSSPVVIMDTPGTIAIENQNKKVGTAGAGDVLHAKLEDTDGFDPLKVTYKWMVGPTELACIAASYTVKIGAAPAQDEVLHDAKVTVEIKYTDRGGSEKTLRSKPVKVVNTPGALTCTYNAPTLSVTLVDPDRINQLAWSVKDANNVEVKTFPPAQVDPPATQWEGSVNTGNQPAPFTVTVIYQDCGSTRRYTMTGKVQQP